MNNINIATINIAGGAGKSTFTKHGLVPQLPNASRISVEDWNSGDGEADLEISAKSFYQLAAQLNTDEEQSFVLDIGTSNSRGMLQHFADLELTRDEIDFWVVPVRAGSKERIDTMRTIASLLELGIDPASIVVVAQAITDIATFEADFAVLKASARDLGLSFATQAVLYNDVYHLLKGGPQTVFDVVRDKPDFKALRTQHRGNEQKLIEIGNQMLLYSLASTAVRNLMAVFESTPLAAAVRGQA
ncbi:MAG: hypothetical protein P4L96_09490 [Rhodoferax sp.]|nr:hypothetical protein [Rhodoferax sp.]